MSAQNPSMPRLDRSDAARARFAALLERHRGILYKVAGSYAFGAEDRADLRQEIAAQLWRAFPRYDPARSFCTWMYRIALNVAISQLRLRERERGAVALDEATADLADTATPEHEHNVQALYRFIAALAPLDRALMLLYLEDRSRREIADVLGLSETNVTTRISRLKQRIANEL